MTADKSSHLPIPADVQQRIADALHDLRFGSIEIQVHDARIVRITRTESVRVDVATSERNSTPQK